MSEPVEVDEAALDEAVSCLIGWCPDCADFTTPGTHPKACAQTCFDCGGGRVVGASHGIANGFITVTK